MKENDDGGDGGDDGGESPKMVEGVLGNSTLVVRCFGPEKDGKTFVDIVCEVMSDASELKTQADQWAFIVERPEFDWSIHRCDLCRDFADYQ
jgi:hypothetical protein